MTGDILAWLNGTRNFTEGIALYEKYGSDPKLQQLFKLGETDSLRRMLFTALKGLISAPAAPVPATAQTPIHITSIPAAAPTENEISQAAKKAADKLYKEMQNKRAELFRLCSIDPMNGEESLPQKNYREKLATEVMDLEKQVNKAYDDYRYALQHGRLPGTDQVTEEPVSLVDLHRTISNLRKAIQRWEIKPESPERSQHLKDKRELLTKLQNQYDEATGKLRSAAGQ